MATRVLATDTKTALESGEILPALFFAGDFAGNTIRLWNGYDNYYLDSELFLGNGWLLGISTIQEVGAIVSSGFSVNLSGIDASIISAVLNNGNSSLYGKVWLCLLNKASSYAVIGDPILLCSGFLSEVKVTQTPDGANITTQYENESIFMKETSKHQYTQEGQRAFYPNDDGFEYVSYTKEWKGFWGVPSA